MYININKKLQISKGERLKNRVVWGFLLNYKQRKREFADKKHPQITMATFILFWNKNKQFVHLVVLLDTKREFKNKRIFSLLFRWSNLFGIGTTLSSTICSVLTFFRIPFCLPIYNEQLMMEWVLEYYFHCCTEL